uniref:Uncharacterized protein n=1 Tax=Peronospora matthiolae TaxID=2874970 RepID=A0AAV1V5M2_9STRA
MRPDATVRDVTYLITFCFLIPSTPKVSPLVVTLPRRFHNKARSTRPIAELSSTRRDGRKPGRIARSHDGDDQQLSGANFSTDATDGIKRRRQHPSVVKSRPSSERREKKTVELVRRLSPRVQHFPAVEAARTVCEKRASCCRRHVERGRRNAFFAAVSASDGSVKPQRFAVHPSRSQSPRLKTTELATVPRVRAAAAIALAIIKQASDVSCLHASSATTGPLCGSKWSGDESMQHEKKTS